MVPPNSTSNLEMLHEVVGHPERDREYLFAASLVFLPTRSGRRR